MMAEMAVLIQPEEVCVVADHGLYRGIADLYAKGL